MDDEKPTMPELTAIQGKNRCIQIAEDIGIKWCVVGTALLDDKTGAIVPAIAHQCGNNALLINMEILRRWVQGQGIADTTWRGLLGVLKVHCPTLAESIEEALTVDDTTDSAPGKPQEPHEHIHPPAAKEREDLATPTTKPSSQQTETLPQATAATSTRQHEPSLPPPEQPTSPPTDQPQPPPMSQPTCPSLQPQSAEWHFADHLKYIYNRPIDTVDTWPPSPGQCYINLAIITREKIKTKEQQEEMYKFMLASLHGGIEQILEKKAPVKLEALLDPEPGKNLECILVEGAPGVGKSTLSWELCKSWAEGKLFQQYSLVLLLRLRDATVQGAETVADLVQYMAADWVEGVSQHLKVTRGKHTLVLLEGLDELPRKLLLQASIFTRLLAGSELRDATIMITSRPSATAQLWQNWKARITRHIEILGFTDENITEYVGSILDQEEIPAFNNYLSTAPSIRQMMYIPLHSGITIEIYRMCTRLQKSLPTNKTALYKVLVQTILTRYLASHPKDKDDKLEVVEFTDLPDDIYPAFAKLLELAYKGITEQQLIFRDRDSEIQHLGFMDVVTELYPLSRRSRYSYNFLHLSIQEFLGACYVSLLDTGKQEGLLHTMCTETHLCNMALFLAGLTKFKDLNRSIVQSAVHSTCKQQWEYEKEGLALSEYALQILYETNDISPLDGYDYYRHDLTDYSPLFIFTAVGYCIAQSQYKWALKLGSDTGDTSQYMHSTERIQLLTQALSTQHEQTPRYSINSLEFYHMQPQLLSPLLPTMNQLRKLELFYAPADILLHTLSAIAASPITTLEEIWLNFSEFSQQAMRELCTLLVNNAQCVSVVRLTDCHIDNEAALCLSRDLSKLSRLRVLGLEGNEITDSGCWE